MKIVRIEIHGVGPALAQEMREKIFEFSNWDEVVVTIVGDCPVDRTGAPRPFLRIISDEDAHALDSHLAKLGLPMEFPPLLRRYLPAEK